MTRPRCSSSCAAFLAACAALALGCSNRPLGDARADATGGLVPWVDGSSAPPRTDAPAPAPAPGPFPTPGPVVPADGGFGPPTPTPQPTPPPPGPRIDGGFGPPAPGPGPAPQPGPAPVPPKCAATTCPAGTICCDYQCGAACVQGTSCPPAPGVVIPCGLCNVDADCSLANLLCTPGGPCECRPRSRFDTVGPMCSACNLPSPGGVTACNGKTAACVLGKCAVR